MKLYTALRWSIAQRGLAGTARAAAAAVARRLRPGAQSPAPVAHPFDLEFGTDTAGMILGRDLAAGKGHAAAITGYTAISPSRFWQVMEAWRQAAGPQNVSRFTFVDIGCGKGRALMLGSQWPFREAVGIELDAALAGVARENLARWQDLRQAACPVSVVQGNALEVPLPAGPLLLFLYNPFSAAVTSLLLQKLAARQADRAEDVYILYQKEDAANPLRSYPGLQLLWRGVPAISDQDRPADPVASDDDEASLYRWPS